MPAPAGDAATGGGPSPAFPAPGGTGTSKPTEVSWSVATRLTVITAAMCSNVLLMNVTRGVFTGDDHFRYPLFVTCIHFLTSWFCAWLFLRMRWHIPKQLKQLRGGGASRAGAAAGSSGLVTTSQAATVLGGATCTTGGPRPTGSDEGNINVAAPSSASEQVYPAATAAFSSEDPGIPDTMDILEEDESLLSDLSRTGGFGSGLELVHLVSGGAGNNKLSDQSGQPQGELQLTQEFNNAKITNPAAVQAPGPSTSAIGSFSWTFLRRQKRERTIPFGLTHRQQLLLIGPLSFCGAASIASSNTALLFLFPHVHELLQQLCPVFNLLLQRTSKNYHVFVYLALVPIIIGSMLCVKGISQQSDEGLASGTQQTSGTADLHLHHPNRPASSPGGVLDLSKEAEEAHAAMDVAMADASDASGEDLFVATKMLGASALLPRGNESTLCFAVMRTIGEVPLLGSYFLGTGTDSSQVARTFCSSADQVMIFDTTQLRDLLGFLLSVDMVAMLQKTASSTWRVFAAMSFEARCGVVFSLLACFFRALKLVTQEMILCGEDVGDTVEPAIAAQQLVQPVGGTSSTTTSTAQPPPHPASPTKKQLQLATKIHALDPPKKTSVVSNSVAVEGTAGTIITEGNSSSSPNYKRGTEVENYQSSVVSTRASGQGGATLTRATTTSPIESLTLPSKEADRIRRRRMAQLIAHIKSLDSICLLYYSSPVNAFLLGALSLLWEGVTPFWQFCTFSLHVRTYALILVSGVIAAAFNIFSYLQVQMFGALTSALVGQVKVPFSLGISVLVFSRPCSPSQVSGIALSALGGMLYFAANRMTKKKTTVLAGSPGGDENEKVDSTMNGNTLGKNKMKRVQLLDTTNPKQMKAEGETGEISRQSSAFVAPVRTWSKYFDRDGFVGQVVGQLEAQCVRDSQFDPSKHD
ncbi:unnamed protein product [Amoebophrya sp. A120]|nr:unnamed protein product [Amoebophrya sp. A120]|eukprot:GSA120T00001564001.1